MENGYKDRIYFDDMGVQKPKNTNKTNTILREITVESSFIIFLNLFK